LTVVRHAYVGYADTPHRVTVTPDGSRVACPGADRLYFWDLETGKEGGSLPLASKATRAFLAPSAG